MAVVVGCIGMGMVGVGNMDNRVVGVGSKDTGVVKMWKFVVIVGCSNGVGCWVRYVG